MNDTTAKISQPIPIEQQRLRFKLRMSVAYDNRLSFGARLLYQVLDDMAGLKGLCWPKQPKLATILDCHVRHVRRFLAELSEFSYISLERKKTYNICKLTCTADRTKTAYHDSPRSDIDVLSDRTQVAYQEGLYPYMNLRIEPSVSVGHMPDKSLTPPMKDKPSCERCQGKGYYLYESVRQDGVRKQMVRCGCNMWGES